MKQKVPTITPAAILSAMQIDCLRHGRPALRRALIRALTSAPALALFRPTAPCRPSVIPLRCRPPTTATRGRPPSGCLSRAVHPLQLHLPGAGHHQSNPNQQHGHGFDLPAGVQTFTVVARDDRPPPEHQRDCQRDGDSGPASQHRSGGYQQC